MTDRLLIVDFGSQVTQLIARRVREAGVYCEILPFQAVDDAKIKAFDPRGIILSGGPASVTEGQSPTAHPAIFTANGAGPRHLLRRADHGQGAGRLGRRRPPPRVRPRRGRDQGLDPPVRRRLAAGRPQAGLDEPRRPRDQAAGRLLGRRHQRERAVRRHRRREPRLLRRAVPSRGRCTRPTAPSCCATSR